MLRGKGRRPANTAAAVMASAAATLATSSITTTTTTTKRAAPALAATKAKKIKQDMDDSGTDTDTPSESAAKQQAPVVGTMKYRKYRERQRNKVINMETELEELRVETEELHKRESKLLYLLLMSGKRDNEIARLSKERDELQLQLALEARYSHTLATMLESFRGRLSDNHVVLPPHPAEEEQPVSGSPPPSEPSQSTQPASQPMPFMPPPMRQASQTIGINNSSFGLNVNATPTNGTQYSFSNNRLPSGLSFSAFLNGQVSDEFLDRVLADSKFPIARDRFLESMMNDEKSLRMSAYRNSDQYVREEQVRLSSSLLNAAVNEREREKFANTYASAAAAVSADAEDVAAAAVALATVGTTPTSSVILSPTKPSSSSSGDSSSPPMESNDVPPLEAENGFALRFKKQANKSPGQLKELLSSDDHSHK